MPPQTSQQQEQQKKPQPSLLERLANWVGHEAELMTPDGWAARALERRVPPAVAPSPGDPAQKPKAQPFGPFARLGSLLSGGGRGPLR